MQCVLQKQGVENMGFFDFFKSKDINKGVEEYRKTKGAVLIDVRTEEEFSYGHIESSLNIPLQSIDNTLKIIKVCVIASDKSS